MKHAGAEALARLAPLLARVREAPRLIEKRPGIFYIRSRAALHFHEDPAGLFADLRLPGDTDFERLDVTGPAGQAKLLARLGVSVSPRRLR